MGHIRHCFNVISGLNGIVPTQVIGAEDPVGKLTFGMDGRVVLVKKVESEEI